VRRPLAITVLAVLKLLTAAVLGLVALVTMAAARGPQSGLALGAGIVVGAIALLAALCAWGLFSLRPVGRWLQIAFSIAGLLGFPLFTLAAIFILIYMFRPGVALLFSRRAAESFSGDERAQLQDLQANGTGVLVAAIVITVVAVPVMGGMFAAIAIPNLLNAIDRGKQKRTMADLRSIATAIESYAVDRNTYPEARTIDELAPLVEPEFIRVVPRSDGWEHPFGVASSKDGYTIYSRGKDGEGSDCAPAVTTRFADEICMTAGRFTRYPTGMQR